MLEILLCSLFTIVPDYLYRRYSQGKRIGHEITIFSVWYELRYGITTCLMLAVALITTVFYFHPSTTTVTNFYRTIPILPESGGRVAEVYVDLSTDVKQGQRLFKLDSAKQEAALETATRRLAEIDAAAVMAKAEIAAALGQVQQARGALREAADELATKRELQSRSPGVVAQRDIDRLEATVASREGSVQAALANQQAAETKLNVLLPAERASAEAQRQQAQVELDKTIVTAGVAGRVEQFVLRVGDYVSPIMRPAGVLVPEGAGRRALVAGFGQIEARVIRAGIVAEVTCISNPWKIIPMVVTRVQDFVAAGQIRAGEQLIDAQSVTRPGTVTAILEPLYEGGLDDVVAGSSCIANAYTSNHDVLADPNIGFLRWLALHAIDAVAVVHAAILRLQALVMPLKLLVFSGH